MNLASAGLERQPFGTRGTPLVLVPYAAQQAAVRFLNVTRNDPRGLGLFHGPPLSGKTSIIRHFAASILDDCAVAIIDGTGKDVPTLLREILSQFGYDIDLASANERFNMIRVFASQQAASQQAPLLIVENAHAMSPLTLETLCELADLTTEGRSALRMILVSDRPMLPIVQAPAMQSISNRVTGQFLLRPLTRTETAKYIHRKLSSGGCKNPRQLVPLPVCDRLHQVSGGWPGKIDRLAVMALSKADRCPLRIAHVPGQLPAASAGGKLTALGQPASKSRLADAGSSVPHLILTSHGKTLKRIVLDSARLMIGRNEHNDLAIDGDFISRQHAILFRKNGTTIVVDLKSKNGTLVNGRRISHQLLINNDIVSIGDYCIKFIDPAARRRTSLRGAGWDETTIAQSIRDLRRQLAV